MSIFPEHQTGCRTIYLQVGTTRESSTVTGETSVHNDDVGTKAGVGGGAEVEVNEAFGSAF